MPITQKIQKRGRLTSSELPLEEETRGFAFQILSMAFFALKWPDTPSSVLLQAVVGHFYILICIPFCTYFQASHVCLHVLYKSIYSFSHKAMNQSRQQVTRIHRLINMAEDDQKSLIYRKKPLYFRYSFGLWQP